mmetsp:Transcript_112056/g.323741  ORF Transcript_112056/g.323741 Transcript_112056/m.323741 type:complete len:679 (-) Transcript_112056:2143-4179(-)|eukprot:CAMPEP_0176020198 /NCGR_PEP_ID=MMETSP0120_2-20121206/9779_1 /TAXON_ID=160619 /ORGANISM="Kryptoperidinium foliaceum, Strain CCMP 1326" /LENGTH=678 /DNA_ID=CAMNT_0017353291 /DNA_START=196 /DNA_END=2232 /DNA_ORIENTATION=+
MTGADKNLSNNIDFTKTQLAVLLGILFLAVDQINPVKIFIHVFPAVAPWHIAVVCIALGTYIWISEFKELLYFSTKIFFHSILSIFFRDVEIIGRDKLPRHGPMIFSINHANQFMDAVMVVCTSQFKVSYLMAEASWKRRIIGDIAWALDVVPVKRAQDAAKPGTGKVVFSKQDFENTKVLSVQGYDTKFTEQLGKKDKIRPNGTAAAVKVTEVVDDSTLLVDGTDIPEEEVDSIFGREEPVAFDILKHIDQKIVYEKVLDRLADGGCVGIFPEGGSHDRTDLLPLKVGVALIAYSALEKDGLNVPIVPVGLNYFRSHRWRGRAVVEYGEPIYIDPSTLNSYKAGGAEKREVCSNLIDRIADSMRSVIVSAPDYDSLQLIHTARRLYQRRGLETAEKQELARRFAEGYKQLMLMVKGDPPEAWKDLQRRLVEYQQELRDLGIRDYQVPALGREKITPSEATEGDEILKEIRLPYQIVHLLIVLALAAVPTLLINLPVGLLAGIYSEKRRKKALAKSKVKVRGFDVMMTEKIVFCLVAIPSLWIFYGVLLATFTDFDGPTIALCILSFPLFAYTGIIVSEAGMVDIKDLRPYYMRLFPSSRRRLKALPQMRKDLQVDIRAFIKKVGPALGEIYFGKVLDWAQIQEKSRKSSFQFVKHPVSPDQAAKEAEAVADEVKKEK